EARMQERLGVDARALWTDDGIALHLPEVESPPALDELILDPEEVQALVSAQLPASALFAARFRENAARSLLLPKRRPGQRTPLWQQRMRSASLLQVAGQYPDFPILAETWREIMSDTFDMPALATLLRAIRSREIRVVAVDTERASPFASSLLFSYVAEYMYEGDQPLAERRAVPIRVAGETRWIAAGDAGRYREAMGASLPIGLPDLFLDAGAEPLESLLRRFARTHVPFVTSDPARRWALSAQSVEAALTGLAARGDVLAGEFRKAAEGREYCHPEVLRILRRRSLAALRREVESVAPEARASSATSTARAAAGTKR